MKRRMEEKVVVDIMAYMRNRGGINIYIVLQETDARGRHSQSITDHFTDTLNLFISSVFNVTNNNTCLYSTSAATTL